MGYRFIEAEKAAHHIGTRMTMKGTADISVTSISQQERQVKALIAA
jgi:hypothetical protein